MKKLITFLVIILSFVAAKAQVVDGAVNGLIDTKLKTFSATLDSVIGKSKASAIALSTVDTLVVPVGYVATFFIHLTVENSKTQETGAGLKMVQVKNMGGMYYITNNSDIVKYAGQSSISTYTWSVISPNNGAPTIQVSGKAQAIKFTIYRMQNLTAL